MLKFTKVIMLGIIMFIAACADKTARTTVPEKTPEISMLTAVNFREAIKKNDANSVLLDIRTPEEYSQGHIKGSRNIDFYSADFKDQLSVLDKSKTYLIYCRSGNRTRAATAIMRELGFNKIIVLENGIIDWSGNNLP